MESFSSSTGSFKIERYPETSLTSLKPWNAADEYILSYLGENNLQSPVAIINDRFGFLSIALHHLKPTVIIDYKSQEKAIQKNLANNGIQLDQITFSDILSINNLKIETAIVKVPKSMELFALYLHQVSQMISEDGIVICGFMTKYFTSSMLDVAQKYFKKAEQSLAYKKSRLLILSEPITKQDEILTETIAVENGDELMQYKGVFSSGKIDMGTRFLLDNLDIYENEDSILDLACGNGIIAYHLEKNNPSSNLYLVDDFYLAVESSKINLPKANCLFNNDLSDFKNQFFDLIVTNPPFHFGHETNIEVSLSLFKQTCRCLKPNGRFVVVANKHLNYATHLRKIYSKVMITAENTKFQIIECKNAII
ncbi:methyltransferase [Carboxylicivirga caseinilyticus]|uniref:methyltransferase n=1 Tax=Carboxylicivirga caseinilyticus TaxID=3417572 RepID=UPI003D3528F6|nr:methyltransferase [Marinilabiliaceae bacterium A049]